MTKGTSRKPEDALAQCGNYALTPVLLCPRGSAAAPCTHHRELDPTLLLKSDSRTIQCKQKRRKKKKVIKRME